MICLTVCCHCFLIVVKCLYSFSDCLNIAFQFFFKIILVSWNTKVVLVSCIDPKKNTCMSIGDKLHVANRERMIRDCIWHNYYTILVKYGCIMILCLAIAH